jgi:hypothetical protein
LCLDAIPGALKYAYLSAQNATAKRQGQYFNYTNDTLGEIIIDTDIVKPKFVFQGRDSVEHVNTKIYGQKDFCGRSGFLRYVDNPLFGQRAPRETGLHIVPRYGNFINAIYPDGNTSALLRDNKIHVKTARSGHELLEVSPLFNRANTFSYNVRAIAVSTNLVAFGIGLRGRCNKCERRKCKCDRR